MTDPEGTIGRAALEGARRIGEGLLARSMREGGGLTWLCPDPPPRREDPVKWRTLESLYDGTAGIALFLGELAAVTGEERFRAATDDATRWLLARCQDPPSGQNGMYVGRAGVCYFLARWATISGDPALLHRACELALPVAVAAPGAPSDLLGGKAGLALSLAHLGSATRDTTLLEALHRALADLVDDAARSARLGPAGLYWDRLGFCVHGLCGVAHGAAGAGLALLEVGRLLRHPAAVWLARQAFLYEEARFEEADLGTWPDLRRDEVFQDLEVHLTAEAVPLALVEPRAMTGWCNGAAGIGLSRLRAFELLGDEPYRAQAERALEIVGRILERPEPPLDLSLCHGLCGKAELFLEAAAAWNRPDHLATASRAAAHLLRAERDRPEIWFGASGRPELAGDPGLFLGAAGLGHFLLRVATGAAIPSVLSPTLPSLPATDAAPTRSSGHDGTVAAARRAVLRSALPRVVALLESSPESASSLENELAGEGDADLLPGWEDRFLDRAAGLLAPDGTPVVALERSKRRLNAAVENDALLTFQAIARRRAGERLGELRDADLLALRLRTRPDVEIWRCGADDGEALLLEPTGGGVREIRLPPLALAVLEDYRGGRGGSEVVAAIGERIGVPAADRPVLEHRVAEQVRAALARGLLEEEA